MGDFIRRDCGINRFHWEAVHRLAESWFMYESDYSTFCYQFLVNFPMANMQMAGRRQKTAWKYAFAGRSTDIAHTPCGTWYKTTYVCNAEQK